MTEKKRSIGKMILWILLLGIVIGIITLAALQWNNIKAVWLNARYSPEEQQAFLIDNQNRMQEILNELNLSGITPLTVEQEELLNSGLITEEEALQMILGKEITSETEEADVEHLIAKVYLLRSTFVGKLNALEAQAIQEYNQSGGNIDALAFGQRFIRQGVALEDQCDAQMEQILSEMERELKKASQSTELIGRIRSTYETEKSVKKAEMLGKYQ